MSTYVNRLQEVPVISVSTFVRRVPEDILQSYVARFGLAFPSGSRPQPSDLLAPLDETGRTKLAAEVERIAVMSEEPGQISLMGVLFGDSVVNTFDNALGRSTWVFVNRLEAFRRAEEARYADGHRRGRIWSGFVGPKQRPVEQTADAIERFKSAIRDLYSSPNVHIDLFEREKKSFKSGAFRIVQATVYREGLPDDEPQFENGQFGWRSRKPVYEGAVTYEPESGSIEVVSDNRQTHPMLARAFAEEFLGGAGKQKQLPLRKYDLHVLLRSHTFPTDAGDGIESVRLTELRLMPMDTESERLTLECKQPTKTLWDMADERLGFSNPMHRGWVPTKAKLVIRFERENGARRGKSLGVTISAPHGCDLKDRTFRENMIAQKYLQRWGLMKNV